MAHHRLGKHETQAVSCLRTRRGPAMEFPHCSLGGSPPAEQSISRTLVVSRCPGAATGTTGSANPREPMAVPIAGSRKSANGPLERRLRAVKAISHSQWNDGYAAYSGPSQGEPRRPGIRPIEASKAVVCYVRNTSTPVVRRVEARLYAPASHCLTTKVSTKPT